MLNLNIFFNRKPFVYLNVTLYRANQDPNCISKSNRYRSHSKGLTHMVLKQIFQNLWHFFIFKTIQLASTHFINNCQCFYPGEPLALGQFTSMGWKIMAILSKTTFNNICEKHTIHFMDLPVGCSEKNYIHFTYQR